MIRLLMIALLLPVLPALEAELLTSIASYHWQRHGQSECNPGVGVSLGAPREGWTPYVAGLVYDDSHNQHATTAVAGVRWGHRLGLDLAAGYLHSTTYEGFAPLPSVFAGSDTIHVHVGALGVRALGLWVRWELP